MNVVKSMEKTSIILATREDAKKSMIVELKLSFGEFWVGGGFFALVILGVCLWFVLKKRKQKRALQQNNNIGGGVQMEQPMVNNGQRSSLEANQTAHVPVQNARDLQGAPVAYGQYNPSAGRQPQKMYPNLDGNSNSNGRYNQDPGPNQV
eukprot:CAMPEP_0114994100 /NCGR_PEP_ID=MMETSP0216-20121206/12922_1 /TAXON_ID=223996 /ORGANISM="Protocruzia adherens, Strain Boccale" /LENGTH=149 /DNA_ID=CAMNT_0002357865 /DNA_START=233 /DNA_END=681 /DNA_ORIENTATION=+